ncbi:DUF5818 domain-containing protein [Sphingobium chlorophenolicum]|uniref:DUF5818 domain-containing protein n=1 Tax=Sphingobium chlorophenolicum TaxID=46429 RepID=UPI00265EC2EE|nr:DUF5818 domain-containing protein [Sphingobium chlorophenolicum]
MPRGTRHVLIGTLRRTRFGHVLEMDGGGVWQLDASWSAAKRHCNQRVTVEGTRSGFDLLDVDRIMPVDQATANQPDRRHPLAMIRDALTSSYEWIRGLIRGSLFH